MEWKRITEAREPVQELHPVWVGWGGVGWGGVGWVQPSPGFPRGGGTGSPSFVGQQALRHDPPLTYLFIISHPRNSEAGPPLLALQPSPALLPSDRAEHGLRQLHACGGPRHCGVPAAAELVAAAQLVGAAGGERSSGLALRRASTAIPTIALGPGAHPLFIRMRSSHGGVGSGEHRVYAQGGNTRRAGEREDGVKYDRTGSKAFR